MDTQALVQPALLVRRTYAVPRETLFAAWTTPELARARDRLVGGVLESRGLQIVVGEPGTGKTSLMAQTERELLGRDDVRLGKILDPSFATETEFLLGVARSFGLALPPRSPAEVKNALSARGLSRDEARRALRLELGTARRFSDNARRYGWGRTVGACLGDVRYAARQLRSHPGFTAVTVLTLALGLGATTAIFSAVNPILFAPLPYPQAARITMVSDFGPNGAPQDVTFGTYLELVARNRSFESMAVVKPWQPTLIGEAEPERLVGQRVSAGFFRTLGVPPVLGRDLDAADDRLNGPRVIVISDALWRRRLGADHQILDAEALALFDFANHPLMAMARAAGEPVERVDAHPLHRHALRLGHPHDLREPIVGARSLGAARDRRDPNQRRPLCLERLEHRVDAVDQHGVPALTTKARRARRPHEEKRSVQECFLRASFVIFAASWLGHGALQRAREGGGAFLVPDHLRNAG